MLTTPSPGYGILIRLEILSKPGMLDRVTSAIGKEDYIIPQCAEPEGSGEGVL
jgi:hypothetical protein